MTALHTLIDKIRQKGLRRSLQLLRERFIYRHWELLTLERPLDLPTPGRTNSERWPLARIDRSHLPAFARYFSHHLSAIDDLLNQGLHGTACFDAQGDAIAMLWVSERDYYDDQLYRCWVRIPPGCLYQFAGEVAPPYRGSAVALTVLRGVWKHYHERGFHNSRMLVDVDNLPSLKLQIHLGFKEIGETVHIYRLFGCLSYTRTAPYHEPRLLHLHKNKRAAIPTPTLQEE